MKNIFYLAAAGAIAFFLYTLYFKKKDETEKSSGSSGGVTYVDTGKGKVNMNAIRKESAMQEGYETANSSDLIIPLGQSQPVGVLTTGPLINSQIKTGVVKVKVNKATKPTLASTL